MERTRSLEPIQWKSRWLMSAARQCLDGGGVREEEEQFVNGGRTERERGKARSRSRGCRRRDTGLKSHARLGSGLGRRRAAGIRETRARLTRTDLSAISTER
jgi:hypothetical protein